MMYPFGNFLPFNDIVHLSNQASQMNRDYFKTIANSAQYKHNSGMSQSTTSPNEYGVLAAQLNQFITLMDNAYGKDWTSISSFN